MDEGRRRVIGIGAVVAGTLAASEAAAAQPAAGEADAGPGRQRRDGPGVACRRRAGTRRRCGCSASQAPDGAPRLGAIGASGRVVDLSAVSGGRQGRPTWSR